jgi:hypothetical protein
MSTKTPPQSRRSRRHLEYASAPGAPAALPAALNAHSVMTILCGDFEATTSLGMKEDAVKEMTGAPACDSPPTQQSLRTPPIQQES